MLFLVTCVYDEGAEKVRGKGQCMGQDLTSSLSYYSNTEMISLFELGVGNDAC